ncbi:glycosyltransferase [Enterococcus hirae]
MNVEEIRKALLELLHEDIEKGKTWFFPSNVNEHYLLMLGLTIKESIQAVGAGIGSLLFMVFLFRSTSIWAFLFYVLAGGIGFLAVWGYKVFKPISDRPNISISDFRKEKKMFQQKQKVYYRRPNKQVKERV